MIVAGIAALFNIILNFLVIPTYGYIGSAYATLFTELLNFSLFVFLLKKEKFTIPFGSMIRPVLAVILMAVPLIYLDWLNLFIIVPFSAFIYFLCLVAFGGVGEEEKLLFRTLLSRK